MVSKGQLETRWPADALRFDRYPPGARVGEFVRHYWIPQWSLPEGAHLDQPVLGYPARNLVIGPDSAESFPPSRTVAVQRLIGASWAFGVLLRPAAARVELTAETILAVRRAMPHDHAEAIRRFEDALSAYRPTENDLLMNCIAQAIEEDPELLRVSVVAERFHLTQRTLERLVRDYLDMSPKWLIQRRRLQEAAHRINQDPAVDLSALAQELGYADYPHFSRDFASVVGATPNEFRHRHTAE